MVFSYKREPVTVEAYGKVFPIPTRTAFLVDSLKEANDRLCSAASTVEKVEATRRGIALFIGEEEAERIFPSEKTEEIDTDEISAFWLFLNEASHESTRRVIEAYAPNKNIIKPV